MHEMSLAEGVLDLIERNAAEQGFARVLSVQLEIGQLAGVDIDAMRFSFDAVTSGTLAADATLDIRAAPGEAWCMACSRGVEISRRGDPCPYCGSYQLQVTGGNDMMLKSLEVE